MSNIFLLDIDCQIFLLDIDCQIQSNLLSELFGGEDDQVEDEVGGEGDEGESDVHVSCQGGIGVVIPENVSGEIEEGDFSPNCSYRSTKVPQRYIAGWLRRFL